MWISTSKARKMIQGTKLNVFTRNVDKGGKWRSVFPIKAFNKSVLLTQLPQPKVEDMLITWLILSSKESLI